MLPLVELYGANELESFRPDHLRAVQQAFVDRGLARKTVNSYVRRIVRAFKWGVGRSMIEPSIHAAIACVEPLKRGRTKAREVPKICSVPPAIVEATIPHLHANPAQQAVLAAMATVQRYTGMRPGALTAMKREHVRADGELLRYDVPDDGNKSAHHDETMMFWLGPRATAAITPLLANLRPKDFVFAFPPRCRTQPRVRVSRTDDCRFVKRACERANVPHWTPHQLRKLRATEIERMHGEKDAAVAIGDTLVVAVDYYIDLDHETRRRLAKETGLRECG